MVNNKIIIDTGQVRHETEVSDHTLQAMSKGILHELRDLEVGSGNGERLGPHEVEVAKQLRELFNNLQDSIKTQG